MIFPKNKKTPSSKEDEVLSRGTTSIRLKYAIFTALSVATALHLKVSLKPLWTSHCAYILIRCFNIPRCNRRSCQALSVPPAMLFTSVTKNSSSLPLQSHIPSAFPHSLAANPASMLRNHTGFKNLSVKFPQMYSLFLSVFLFCISKISTEAGESQVLSPAFCFPCKALISSLQT